MAAEVDRTVSIVGLLCTPLDIAAQDMPSPRIAIDDLLVVFQSAVYKYTAIHLQFLGHAAPAQILV